MRRPLLRSPKLSTRSSRWEDHFPDKTDEQIIRTLRSFASRDERPEKDSIRWFAARLERTRRQRQAIDALEKLGWLFSYDDGFDAGNNRAPDRLRERLGKVFFNDVVSADHKADDPGWPPPAKDLHLALEQLAKLPRLRQSNLSRSKITDTGMAYLEAMPQLDSIYLEETEITDAGLKSLAGLHRLAFLDLQSNRITDAGLASLGGLTELETLGLSLTQVSDAGLVHLKSLHKLQKLYLAGCHITNAGLEHLEAFDDLQTLALGGTSITAAGLAHLKGLRELRDLELIQTKIADADLEHLNLLTRLDSLDLRGTQVTSDGVKKLRRALPECKIRDAAGRAYSADDEEETADRSPRPAPSTESMAQEVEWNLKQLRPHFAGKTDEQIIQALRELHRQR